MILGFYWKGVNVIGVIVLIFVGIVIYLIFEILKIKIFVLYNIVLGFVVVIIVFIVVLYFGKKFDEKIIKIFFEY